MAQPNRGRGFHLLRLVSAVAPVLLELFRALASVPDRADGRCSTAGAPRNGETQRTHIQKGQWVMRSLGVSTRDAR
jgi:hypothetical protein